MADRIDGWWTIGEAPNYEINDEGVVRHKASGRIVKHRDKGTGSDYRYVTLSAFGSIIGRSIKVLIETGRKYQGVDNGRDLEEDSGSSDLRSQYRRRD